MSHGNDQALATRIRAALDDLDRVVARAQALARRAQETGDDGYWDGVALNLHGFYAGVERIFEDIARHLDGSVPEGPDWHRALLLQMSAPVDGIRPPVIRPDTRFCLDEYRGFRHVVRNVYTFNLRPSRLQELVADLPHCHGLLRQDLTAFLELLARCNDEG